MSRRAISRIITLYFSEGNVIIHGSLRVAKNLEIVFTIRTLEPDFLTMILIFDYPLL